MIFQNEPAGIGSRLAVCTAVLLASMSQAAAQGRLGGSIGKQDKVISGGESAPSRPAARPAPRASRPASRQRAQPSERASSGGRSLTGVWSWTGQCAKYASPFVGIVTFNQTGNTLTGTHGNTNMWDAGSISDGSVSGNRVSFTRTFGSYADHLVLTWSGNRMSGVLPNTEHSGRCLMTFTRR